MRQVECKPDPQAVPLPLDTNVRVGAAVASMVEQLAPQPVELEPRQRADRVARYVNAQLGQLRLDDQADPAYLRHLESLRVTFTAALPISINERIRASMRDGATDQQLLDALAAMTSELPQHDHGGESQPPPTGDVRVVCSMGIVGT